MGTEMKTPQDIMSEVLDLLVYDDAYNETKPSKEEPIKLAIPDETVKLIEEKFNLEYVGYFFGNKADYTDCFVKDNDMYLVRGLMAGDTPNIWGETYQILSKGLDTYTGDITKVIGMAKTTYERLEKRPEFKYLDSDICKGAVYEAGWRFSLVDGYMYRPLLLCR